MYELKVITHFAAAHQLKLVAKKCENLHGHNWKIEVCIAGEKLNAAGVLIDFGILKQHLSGIIGKLDHRFLNEMNLFEGGNPSSENVARYINDALQTVLDQELETSAGRIPLKVSRVTAWESEDACATYSAD